MDQPRDPPAPITMHDVVEHVDGYVGTAPSPSLGLLDVAMLCPTHLRWVPGPAWDPGLSRRNATRQGISAAS